jgi:hypothetical protein
MPIPTIVFGILLSTLYGGLYHLIRGGPIRRLLLFLVLAWAGFWLGDTLGWLLGWTFGQIGIMNAGMGTILAFVFMGIGDLIGLILKRRNG